MMVQQPWLRRWLLPPPPYGAEPLAAMEDLDAVASVPLPRWQWVGSDSHQQGTKWFALGCAASCVAIANILVTHSRDKRALNHRPGSLLVLRAQFELAFCGGALLSLIYSSLAQPDPEHTVDACLSLKANASFAERRLCIPGCEASAVWLQFFEIGSEGYFVVIAVDLLLNTLPSQAFHDSKRRLRWYHAYVLGVSLVRVPFAAAPRALLLAARSRALLPTDSPVDRGGVALQLASAGLIWTDTWAPSDHILQTVCFIPSFGSWQGVERLLPTSWSGLLGGWSMIYVVYFLYYSLAVCTVAWAAWRLKRGLPRTLATRERRIKEGRSIVGVFLIYLMVQIVLYLYIRQQHRATRSRDGVLVASDDSNDQHGAKRLLAFILGSRGLADLFVWHTVVMPLASGGDTVTGRLCKRLKATCGSRGSADLTSGILPHVQDVRTSCPPRIESGRSGAAASAAATAAVPRVSGEDSVELNVALQGEILYFLLLGLRAAADDNRAEINLAAAARSDHVVAHMMEESERLHGHKWTLDDCEASLERWNFQFTSYRGEEFRSLRTSFGVGQDEYRTSMSRYTKAVFDGGGSGAIMFYSGDERFVVKQITKEESQVLQEMLTNYARHVERGGSSTTEEEEEEEEEEEGSDSGAVGGRERQQHSLLPRIVQCVRIQMYATSLYFMVTENIMYHAEGEGEVTETYDLKGSWVNRNATLPRRGQAARCRHCNERYVVGEPGPSAEDGGCDGTPSSSSSSSSNGSGHRACSASANREHAPRVTFKDGDLIHKVYLDEDRRDTLLSTLRRDAEFLREHGIMDYSLLLGVRHRRYKIGEAPVGIAGQLRSSGNYSNCDLSDDQLPGMVASGDSSRAFSVSAPDSSSEVGHSSAAGSNTAGSGAASSSLAGSGRVSGRVSASSRRVSDRASSTRTLDIERPSLTESRMRLEGNPSLPFFREDKGGLAAAMVVGAETYYVGVIDILQRWTWRKWFELQWKSVVLRSDRAGLSVMEPEQYSERWAQMVEGITEVPAELR